VTARAIMKIARDKALVYFRRIGDRVRRVAETRFT
jgi:hypothetical protein